MSDSGSSDDERTARRRARGQRKQGTVPATPPTRPKRAPTQPAPAPTQPAPAQTQRAPAATPPQPAPPQPAPAPGPSQATQKLPKQFKLKRGELEVIGRSDDTPMVIKMKCTLPSGQEKLVCKLISLIRVG